MLALQQECQLDSFRQTIEMFGSDGFQIARALFYFVFVLRDITNGVLSQRCIPHICLMHAFSVFIFQRRFRVNLDRDLESLRNSNLLRTGPSQSQHKHRLSKILANITFLHPVRVLRKKIYGFIKRKKVFVKFFYFRMIFS